MLRIDKYFFPVKSAEIKYETNRFGTGWSIDIECNAPEIEAIDYQELEKDEELEKTDEMLYVYPRLYSEIAKIDLNPQMPLNTQQCEITKAYDSERRPILCLYTFEHESVVNFKMRFEKRNEDLFIIGFGKGLISGKETPIEIETKINVG